MNSYMPLWLRPPSTAAAPLLTSTISLSLLLDGISRAYSWFVVTFFFRDLTVEFEVDRTVIKQDLRLRIHDKTGDREEVVDSDRFLIGRVKG